MEEWNVGDEWYGKVDTDYSGVTATIDRVTDYQVQVRFDAVVKSSLGKVFHKTRFKRLFSKQHEQLNMFKKERW